MRGSGDITPPEPSLRHNPDFIRLWTGGAVSGLGATITGLAYPLLALSVTTSTGLAGLLGLVALAVGSLTQLPAGSIVDRLPLRGVLVGADLIRIAGTAALAISLILGYLSLWQLLAVAAVNSIAASFSGVAHSVAVRHVVPATQLPQAFALTEGRGHAISLLGQPVGGLLFGAAPALPLVADLASFSVSAALSASIKQPMQPTEKQGTHPRFRQDLLTGLRFLWNEPFLQATLLAAAFYQFVFVGTVFALIAHLTATGVSAFGLGVMFAIAAVGGILGAIVAPALQDRLPLRAMVLIMGWTATTVFAILAAGPQPVIAGALIGCIYFTSAPANAVLLAAQIQRTPTHLQGRVIAAAFLISGLVAPFGAPAAGVLLDAAGPPITFVALAGATAVITIAVHLNKAVRHIPEADL